MLPKSLLSIKGRSCNQTLLVHQDTTKKTTFYEKIGLWFLSSALPLINIYVTLTIQGYLNEIQPGFKFEIDVLMVFLTYVFRPNVKMLTDRRTSAIHILEMITQFIHVIH